VGTSTPWIVANNVASDLESAARTTAAEFRIGGVQLLMRPQSVHLLSAAVIALGLLLPATRAQDSGVVLLHKMQSALGGADKIAAIHDLDWTVQADAFEHDGKSIGQVTKRTRWIRPNYLRLDQIGPGDTYVLYFDGKQGWEILPDKPGVRDLVGDELKFAQRYLSGFMLTLWVADRVKGYTITSPSANVIGFSVNGNSPQITLDPKTWLPADTSEWMTVQGIRFPARSLNVHPGDGSADIRTTAVKFNSRLNPRDLAAKPDDLKPKMQ